MSACVNLPLHHKVQKFSSGTGSPGWSRKKGRKTVVVNGCGVVVGGVINVCCSDKYDKVEKTRTDKDDRKDRSKDSQVF